MFGMRFALDVAFVDADGVVVAQYPNLRPGARTGWHRAARSALELGPDVLSESGTIVGDRLAFSSFPQERPHDQQAAATQSIASA